ncbi:PAN domain-containing protein [Nitrosomonas sp. Nm51]|uniref:PAN domain-containing protein n=1 Tax=Nitrosomonas sp. Nm51 TaxID=133720 RepID=UPI0008BF95EC|nr:PAN domain-containing protein [Nitrosomonas sp. Nm51]SER81542.1 PAN domain-containing protein [Nitrosomonas sp. Nm51]
MRKSIQSNCFTVMAVSFIVTCLVGWNLGMANPMGKAEFQFDRPGGDYHKFKANSFGQCAASCATSAKCRAYTYVNQTDMC